MTRRIASLLVESISSNTATGTDGADRDGTIFRQNSDLAAAAAASTSGAGHSEILSAWGGGHLHDPAATPLEMANACERILADSKCVTLPAASRRALAEHLEPRQHAARMMDIYARATRRGTKPAVAAAQTEGGYR